MNDFDLYDNPAYAEKLFNEREETGNKSVKHDHRPFHTYEEMLENGMINSEYAFLEANNGKRKTEEK